MEAATPPAIVGEAEAGRSSAVLKELEKLSKGIETDTFDIGELLAEVKSQQYFQSWNYESFNEYVDKALNMKPRKAAYLVRIVTVSEIMGLPRARYEKLGMTKVREIFSLDPNGFFVNQEKAQNEPMSGHILRLLDEAPDMTPTEVTAEVQRLKGLDKENTLVWARAKIPKAAKEQVYDVAIELAKARLGSVGREDDGTAIDYSDGAALEAICADFNSDPNNQPETEKESGNNA